MKKKKLLLTLLALAIVTSVTAGTLAVYTKSVELKGDILIKKFAFNADGEQYSNQPIKLAPTEKQSYKFDVTNFETSTTPAEVPLGYVIAIDFSGATAQMPGLTAILMEDGKQVGDKTTNGIIKWNNKTPENIATTHKYELIVAWDEGIDSQHNIAGQGPLNTSGLVISVSATQSVTAAGE